MQSDVRILENFQEYNKQGIYSNLEDKLNQDVANGIYKMPFFSRYAAWDFNGLVWWNDELRYWCIEISKYKKYITTHMAETLEELITEVKNTHGEK